jgi:hypothetical protein
MLTSPAKSVIYLDSHPIPNPYQNPLLGLIEGKAQVEISRAGLELKKVIVYLNSITGGAIGSLPTLVALNLPHRLLTLLWIAHTLFDESFFHSEDYFKFLDHDARMLFRAIAQVSLKQWQEEIVETVSILNIDPKIGFPLGHPLPDRFYRQHPLKEKANHYYPVELFHVLLRDEREAELIELLSDLGANKIMIQNQANSSERFEGDSDALLRSSLGVPQASADRTFEFPGKHWSSDLKFDPTRYLWLAYEQTWQTIAHTRVYQGCSSASLELTIDMANAISGQIDQIKNLAAEYKSINLESLSTLKSRILQPRKLCVTFPTSVKALH